MANVDVQNAWAYGCVHLPLLWHSIVMQGYLLTSAKSSHVVLLFMSKSADRGPQKPLESSVPSRTECTYLFRAGIAVDDRQGMLAQH